MSEVRSRSRSTALSSHISLFLVERSPPNQARKEAQTHLYQPDALAFFTFVPTPPPLLFLALRSEPVGDTLTPAVDDVALGLQEIERGRVVTVRAEEQEQQLSR